MKLYLVEPRSDYLGPIGMAYGDAYRINHEGDGDHIMICADGEFTIEAAKVFIIDERIIVEGFVMGTANPNAIYKSVRIEGATTVEECERHRRWLKTVGQNYPKPKYK